MEKKSIWKGILDHMYASSSLALIVTSNYEAGGIKYDSIWWRYIISLSYDKVCSTDLFVENLLCSLGDGRGISFWHCNWLPNQTLKEAFPNLFLFSPFSNKSVV